MAKNQNVVRYQRPFHLNIGIIIFGIIFFDFAFYVYSYFTSTHISAYEVIHGTIAVNNTYTGLALRSEEIVQSEYTGAVNYYIKDASKVGAGNLIYSVDADGSISDQINTANQDVSSLDEESLAEVEQRISDYSNGYQPEAFYEVYNFKSDLNAQISEALSIKALNSIADSVTAAESHSTFHKGTAVRDGIVVYYTDGFETVTPENYTPDMFDESAYTKENLKERNSITAGESAYKLITSENWQLVIPIEEDTKRQLADASSVQIRFTKDDSVTRASCIIEEKDDASYLILELSHSMIRFATDRYVEVELLFDEEKGLKIPNSAIATKDFYMVPMEFFGKGDNSSQDGIIVRRTVKDGTAQDSFITPTIYFSTEYDYYVDGEELTVGDVILKPDSSKTYTVGETAKLEGIYCINKGYAVFRQIDIIYQNAEYSIIRSGTDYGVSLYDHIALDGSTVVENALIND